MIKNKAKLNVEILDNLVVFRKTNRERCVIKIKVIDTQKTSKHSCRNEKRDLVPPLRENKKGTLPKV